jgi:hypothetical protein
MCEVINPLESLNNLVYLLKHSSDHEKRIYILVWRKRSSPGLMKSTAEPFVFARNSPLLSDGNYS